MVERLDSLRRFLLALRVRSDEGRDGYDFLEDPDDREVILLKLIDLGFGLFVRYAIAAQIQLTWKHWLKFTV